MSDLQKNAPEILQTKALTAKTIAIVVIVFLAIYVISIVSVFGCALLGYETPCESRFATFGQFGDSFGVVTSFATVGGLVLLYCAYLLQREELRQLRDVMTEQRQVMDAQHKAMSLQAFESTLFNMCKLYSEILSQTFVSYGESYMEPKTEHGRAGLKHIIMHPSHMLQPGSFDVETFLKNKEQQFSPYEGCFRLLHRIFKFIAARDGLTEEQKQEYSRIPRALLSNIELEAVILINCQTDRGRGMLTFAKQFDLLDNYPDTGVVVNGFAAIILRKRYNEMDADK